MFIQGNKDSTRSNGRISSGISGKSKLTLFDDKCSNDFNNVYVKQEDLNKLNFCNLMFSKSESIEYNTLNIKKEDIEIKSEPFDAEYERNIVGHSIIGLRDEKLQPTAFVKTENNKISHHESLQRIDSIEVYNYYQQHWFSPSLEELNLEDKSREERIEITRHEFQRHLFQIKRSNVGLSNKLPVIGPRYLKQKKRLKKSKQYHANLPLPKICEIDNCSSPAMPCARHCIIHIMHNTDQVLFQYCTAKFADNTQCSVPVFDITHELPLCREHTRKRDHYKLHHEAKPKKLRKKVKPSAMIRPQKRSKKKKKPHKPLNVELPPASGIINALDMKEVGIHEIIETESPELVENMEIVDQVLDLNEAGLEQELGVQASHILEETDISNVLNTIHGDEFNDFFAVNRNGEYEPSREEAEELEKALAEVDNDVKSLEKLSQTHGILENFLDDHVIAEQLVQLPDVFHNGYPSCGENMVSQTSSYLLPIEPRTNS